MPAHPVPSRKSIESWLSQPRFARYLEVARGDDAKALELYLWNTGLAQAVLRDVSFFEVALRNSYGRALDKFWLGHGHWFFDDDSPIRRPILRTNKRGNVTDANRINRNSIDRLRDSLGSHASPDRIVSNLTLGFWAHMSDRNHERDVWIPILHRVWPEGTSRSALNKCVANINAVRNRAAHNEHLFEVNRGHCLTLATCHSAVKLFGHLAPEAHRYIYGDKCFASSAEEFLDANPAPCTVSILALSCLVHN